MSVMDAVPAELVNGLRRDLERLMDAHRTRRFVRSGAAQAGVSARTAQLRRVGAAVDDPRRSGPVGVIPTHPVATSDPSVLRWAVPDGLFSFVGPVRAVPSRLQDLLDEGVLARLEVVPGALLTRLGDGHAWAEVGAHVRTALVDGLAAPERWSGNEDARPLGADAALEAAARQIAEGVVGEFARSHGGYIRVLGCHEGVVEVAMEGACHGCAAASITMHARLEHLLRNRCAWLVEVHEARGHVARAAFAMDGAGAVESRSISVPLTLTRR